MYIRSTFALDEPTAHGLTQLARKWGVSKSEALRRAVARAQEHPGPGNTMTPQDALRALKQKPLLSHAEGKSWRAANAQARRESDDAADRRAAPRVRRR
ncbi:MAG: ribbon-helix-helix protein, CopG family [Rhodanobacteraceae bacterium]